MKNTSVLVFTMNLFAMVRNCIGQCPFPGISRNAYGKLNTRNISWMEDRHKQFQRGETIAYNCLSNTPNKRDDIVITCGADGNWSGESELEKIQCPGKLK